MWWRILVSLPVPWTQKSPWINYSQHPTLPKTQGTPDTDAQDLHNVDLFSGQGAIHRAFSAALVVGTALLQKKHWFEIHVHACAWLCMHIFFQIPLVWFIPCALRSEMTTTWSRVLLSSQFHPNSCVCVRMIVSHSMVASGDLMETISEERIWQRSIRGWWWHNHYVLISDF